MKNFGEIEDTRSPLPYPTTQLRKGADATYAKLNAKTVANLGGKKSEQLTGLLGLGDNPGTLWGHASHAPTRNALAEQIAIRVSGEWNPDKPMFFLTLIHDGWATRLSDARIDLVEIRQRTRDCLDLIGFEGIAFIEFDTLVQHSTAEAGHLILPHIHAYGFLEPNDRKRREQLRKLRESKMLISFNGASTVTCKKMATREDVMHTICYGLKLPVVVKRYVPKKGYPNEYVRRTCRRQMHTLNVTLEILSLCRQKDLILTVGGKTRWLTDACEAVDPSMRSRSPIYTVRQINRIWRAVHRSNRFSNRGTVSVRTGR